MYSSLSHRRVWGIYVTHVSVLFLAVLIVNLDPGNVDLINVLLCGTILLVHGLLCDLHLAILWYVLHQR